MNKKTKILILVLAVFLVLSFVKNMIVQTIVGSVISRAAHVPVSIGSTSVGILSTKIDMKNIRFQNPRNFPERLMLHISRVFINFDPGPLMKGQAHFEEVRLDLKELVVIKNRDGLVNVDAVKPREDEKRKAKEPKKAKEMKLKIDKLYLSIGQVVYKDYSLGGKPRIEVFDINIENREYRNIEDPASVVSLIMFETLTQTTLNKLLKLDLGDFRGQLSDITGTGGTVLEKATDRVLSLFK